MSYHDYQKMLGIDMSRAEEVPRYDFSAKELGWDLTKFDGNGTLYYDDHSKRGRWLNFYMWKGNDDMIAYIKQKITEAGYDVEHLTACLGGNGHYSLVPAKHESSET